MKEKTRTEEYYYHIMEWVTEKRERERATESSSYFIFIIITFWHNVCMYIIQNFVT